MTRDPWECPRCKRVLAPHVDVCPCSEGGTGVLAPVSPLPVAPSSPSIAPYPFPGSGITVTGSGVSTTGGTAWQGVTFTATNAAA